MPDPLPLLTTEIVLQDAIVTRLRATAAVTAIVPADSIFDRTRRPEKAICIVVGEDQLVREDLTLKEQFVRIYTTLHVWDRRQDFSYVKAASGAIRAAMRAPLPLLLNDARVCITTFDGARFMRDPGGDYVHAVVTLNSLICEVV